MKHRANKSQEIVLIGLVLCLGLLAGFWAGQFSSTMHQAHDPHKTSSEHDLSIVGEAWKIIRSAYADPASINSKRLAYSAIAGMVDSLGDTAHSRFLSPDMVAVGQRLAQGKIDGIGAEISVEDYRIVIVAPLDGSPARYAGLRPGDVILGINGEDIRGLPVGEVQRRMNCPAGGQVRLMILRAEISQPQEFTVRCESRSIDLVTWSFIPGTAIAYVRITSFGYNATIELSNTLEVAQKQGAQSVILDLRNNPGGLVTEAVASASLFLRGGVVMLEREPSGRVHQVTALGEVTATSIPLVLLVNAGTASAAEIVAGALQDADRAELVGEQTFGAGTILKSFVLSDGSALVLAVNEWLTPSGAKVWHEGIQPDILVSLPDDAFPLTAQETNEMGAGGNWGIHDAQLQAALRALDQK